jgi:hypothetical protein
MSRNNFTPPPGAYHYSAPHFEEPITAPRPHKLSPEVPVNVSVCSKILFAFIHRSSLTDGKIFGSRVDSE